MHPHATVLHLASQQGGVVLRGQAIDAGFTTDQIDWRVSTGEWRTVVTGGYRLIEMLGRLSRLRSAATVLPNATVSHYSAAAFHDVQGISREIVSVTVPSKTTHTFPGVRVFRNDDLAADHLTRIRGLATTTLERTIVDLAATVSPRHLEFVVDDLLASGRSGVADLRAVLDSVARRGKPGVGSMRAILDDRSAGDENRSRLERAGLALLAEGGFTGYQASTRCLGRSVVDSILHFRLTALPSNGTRSDGTPRSALSRWIESATALRSSTDGECSGSLGSTYGTIRTEQLTRFALYSAPSNATA